MRGLRAIWVTYGMGGCRVGFRIQTAYMYSARYFEYVKIFM